LPVRTAELKANAGAQEEGGPKALAFGSTPAISRYFAI
jgi:hypothetical protein